MVGGDPLGKDHLLIELTVDLPHFLYLFHALTLIEKSLIVLTESLTGHQSRSPTVLERRGKESKLLLSSSDGMSWNIFTCPDPRLNQVTR